jgi:serine/threonine protein kinase
MNGEILFICNKIIKAKRPEDIFGILKSEDKDECLRELKKQLMFLAKSVHPDLQKGEGKKVLEEATRVLYENFSDAKDLISNGSYGISKEPEKIILEIKEFTYELYPNFIEGDFCKVYFGKRSSGLNSDNVCLKVINDPNNNDLLLNENEILRNIRHKSLPVCLDGFIDVNDGRMVNVLKRIENGYDLYSVRRYFPSGLPERHASWVLARILSVLGHLHSNKIIHGSIEPGNVMITPYNHNGFLIDFVLSIPEANTSGKKYFGANSYSAPEIKSKSSPHPASDMYSLGKTLVYLLGGSGEDFPDGISPKLENFIKGCLVKDPSKRKNDAWKAWFELTELRDIIYGKLRRFEKLEIGD